MIRNLGQVAAIYIGSSAPRNTNLIWLDNTVVPFVFRAYDGSAWSEIATHKWVRAYVDGWLVTLPPRQLADDGDYMLINSNNVNYKITVKDFVKSAVGNPLDFKGVIRVSADFPNPSTLEAGDMYVIITSPVGGTVTDPYSGKTFEDSEKIVWDEVTRSWESLGKINITVNLTTSYSETEVTIHSSAGKETTIQGVTDQLAGVMLPGQYSWLQALSNGSIVPGDPSSLTPLTPAHKHNYNDIINRLVSQQGTGESTIDPMSQKATTDALNLKFDKASVLQVSGAATDKVMSQKAVTDALKTLSDDFNNKLTNYLPLAGGTMTGSIVMSNNITIQSKDASGNLRRLIGKGTDNVTYIGDSGGHIFLYSDAADISHIRNGTSYRIWDASNLPTPASTTDLNNYLPLIGGTLTGQLTIKQSVDIKLRLQSTDADNYCIIQAIDSQASQLGVFGYAGDKWAIGHNGTYYEIWDKYNLTNPVTYTTNTYNHATLTNKDGQYFTYIKAGTNGLLPHSKVALASGGAGFLGTSDQGFSAAYINNLHTNKVTFGEGSFIDNKSGDSDHKGIGFYTSQNAACPVYVGSLCVSNSYANGAPNIPTNGIYSIGVIKSAAGFTSNFRQTNLNLAKTGNDVLYISSFTVDAAGSPGTDSNTGESVNDGMFLTYFWVNDNAFQLAADIDGTGIAYRQYIPSSGNSTTGWKFLADTNWVVSKINSSTSNFLKKTGDTATGQIILDSNGIAFEANIWTNDLTPNRNYRGYLQVLDAYNASSAGGPTNFGTVLQVNSRNAHWANQLWFPGTAKSSKNGLYYRHMAYGETTYGEWHRLLTNKDVNILSTSHNNNPNSLPTNQIFYAETQGVAGTPTSSGLLFSVQGGDEGIQLWAGANRTELYYRTKWASSFGNWIKLATTSDIGNYLPLTGGTLTGQLTIKQSVDIKLRLQSTDADNYCIIQAIDSQASQLGVFGYAGDKWAIGHNGTYYEIWDKYNLTNPVTYTTNTYNHATLTNKDGQYFTYIKAGTNGLLPHSKVALASGGAGFLGTSDQGFSAAYINNLHTNKVTFGEGSFIDNKSGDSDHKGIGFYTSQNAACPVYVGSLCVSNSYANGAPNIPTNGIYSIGVIKSAAGFTSNFRQTNLNLAKTGNDVLYISSFTVDAAGSPGTDSNTGESVNDGMFLTYFWVNDNAFQLAADIDGTGIAYRQYIPSSGNSTTGWKFLADTNWVVSKINSSTSNFLKKTGDTATGQIILDSNGIAFEANIWTNDLTPNRNYRGYLQVLDAYNASSAGGPTNFGTVLQVNSRNAHWANQLWFPGTAKSSKNGLYYRHMAYGETTYGEWHRLLTNKDVNILSTSHNNNPNSLPTNQIFYAETQGVAGTPTSSGLLFSVQGGDEGIQLWAGANRTELYYRTKWASSFGNWIKLATTSDIGNYLPLTGGTLNAASSNVLNLNFAAGTETFMRVLRNGTASAAIGFMDDLGAYIYNYNSNKYLFIGNDGYARVGTTSGSTRLALITDIPTVSGYLPLSGGTLTGALTMSSRRNNIVVDVVGGAGQSWNEGAGALSVQVPSDSGQTPLLLARRSGAAIDTTTAAERLLSMELLNTGNTFRITLSNTSTFQLDLSTAKGFLFGKTIATTDQIPSIPSISISNSGSGNAVTAISASGHTLTVTKGATYLTSHQTIYNLTFQAGKFTAKTFDPNGAAATVNIPTKTSHITNDSGFITSSALNGYATQAWVNSQNFVKSTSTKKVTDIQPVDALPATQASGVLYLVFG